jgi:hypothetical protein
MKEISLTQGRVALVDDDDFESLSQYKWCSHFNPLAPVGRQHRAIRRTKSRGGIPRQLILMHRAVMGACPTDPQVDHKNGNPLDNRKENLRFATSSQNHANRQIGANNTSGYKGVSRCHGGRVERFKAQVKVNGVAHFLGRFDTAIEAAKAYNEAAKRLFGEFAYLNQFNCKL